MSLLSCVADIGVDCRERRLRADTVEKLQNCANSSLPGFGVFQQNQPTAVVRRLCISSVNPPLCIIINSFLSIQSQSFSRRFVLRPVTSRPADRAKDAMRKMGDT